MPITLDVSKLTEESRKFSGSEPSSFLDVDNGSSVRFEGPVRYDLNAFIVSDELIIRGNLSVEVTFKCSRCAEFFPAEVADSGFESSIEVDDMESVDLTPDIRETMILAFPSYPVCRVDCKGLCPACGIDLNKESCGCKPPEDNRWNALDDLNVD